MASTLIQTFDLNSDAYSDAVKLGATAASFNFDLEVHANYVRFVGGFVVATGQSTTEHQIVVNVNEVLGSDISLRNSQSGAIGAVLPAASMPESAAPQALETGSWYYQEGGNIRIRSGYADPDNGVLSAGTIVQFDVKLLFT